MDPRRPICRETEEPGLGRRGGPTGWNPLPPGGAGGPQGWSREIQAGLGGTDGVRRGAWEESFRPTRASAASRCSCRSEGPDVQARQEAPGACGCSRRESGVPQDWSIRVEHV